jgi:hypothetical protein
MESKDLDSYYGETTDMAGLTFRLLRKPSPYGMIPFWQSEIYNVYAPLNFKDIALVVEVTISDQENKDLDHMKCVVGGLRYKHEVPDFKTYVIICRVVLETLLEENNGRR